MSGASARRPILRLVAVAACALLPASPAMPAGQGHSHEETHAAASGRLHAGASLIETRQLYLDQCAACHGPRGHGGEKAPVDFSAPDALVRLTREAISQAVGQRHAGRLAHELSDGDLAEVTDYIRNYLMLPAPDTDSETGRAIYARTCSVCHGDRGDGASWAKNSLYPPPADFTQHGLLSVTREQMIEAVAFGKDRTAMMPFAVHLGRDEIAATVDYIRAAFMKEGHGAPAGGHEHGHGSHDAAMADPAYPDGPARNPTWGRAFYNANCAECHGDKGDGEGRRAYFMLKKPENFLGREARTGLDRKTLFEMIGKGVNGTTMPAWNKVLTAQEIADVAEYVYRTFLHPEQYGGQEFGPLDWRPASSEHNGTKKN